MKIEMLSSYKHKAAEEVLYPPKGWGKSRMDVSAIDELTRSNKELEQFAFLAAHDLQQPLVVVSLYAGLLNRKYKGKLDDKADEMMSAIVDSTERMQQLIRSLLAYARVGKSEMQPQELNGRAILKRATDNLKVSMEESSAQISYEGCEIIKGDEIQLTQLFQNLINNAIKFRRKETTPRIRISAQENDQGWCFSIQDNGIGIESGDMQSVFDLFKRLHAQDDYEGCGIGLALCKKIVESHGGKIWIKSKIGEGTTFHFTISK